MYSKFYGLPSKSLKATWKLELASILNLMHSGLSNGIAAAKFSNNKTPAKRHITTLTNCCYSFVSVLVLLQSLIRLVHYKKEKSKVPELSKCKPMKKTFLLIFL